jgi:hypothetical protein
VNKDARKFFKCIYYKSIIFNKPYTKDQALQPPQLRSAQHYGKTKILYKTLIYNKLYKISTFNPYNITVLRTGEGIILQQTYGLESASYSLANQQPNCNGETDNNANETEYERERYTADPKHNYVLYFRYSIPLLQDNTLSTIITTYPQLLMQTKSAWRDV